MRTRLQTMPAAILFVILGWFALCAPWFVAKKTVPYDSKTQFYSTLYFVSQSIRGGELPFWNPFVYGGYPTLSDPQSMIFSPLALALMAIVDRPSIYWFDAIELLHLLIGGIGMLFLCRRFGYLPLACCFAAAVYMFGGSAAGRMQHVPIILAYGFFPFALFALSAALDTGRLRWAMAAGILAGIMAAHQNQVAYLFSWVLLGHAAYRVVASPSIGVFIATRFSVLLTCLATGLVTIAIPLYATLQFLPLSNRPEIPYELAVQRSSLHPTAFVSLLIRNFFCSKTRCLPFYLRPWLLQSS